MTLNGIMALILYYFTEFGSFRGALRKSGWRCRRKKSSRSLSHLMTSFSCCNVLRSICVWLQDAGTQSCAASLQVRSTDCIH